MGLIIFMLVEVIHFYIVAVTRHTLNEPLLVSFNKMYMCHSKINKPKVVKTGGSLMQVESIALCNSFDLHLSRVMRKPDFGICENKDADQLRGNRYADQRLCFPYLDSTIPLLPKSEISSL